MKKIICANLIVLILFSLLRSQELRGTWIARDQLGTKEALAQAIDSLAANNFNVIYVNAWSRGYPLWKSEVFYQHTGIYIDPAFVGRDILAEAIAEAHKHGLHVEAWFEYGFVGGYELYYPGINGKGPIFDAHPNWVAKRLDGGEKDNSNFYWMVQTRKDVQDFLIALALEIARNYDIDGIELDRIRYSSTQYGYDSYTDSLYRLENNGNSPPTNYNDPQWIRWRADKLNEFQARIYDSLKTYNPKLNISNAPSLYSSSQYTSYINFCQDWAWWVNNNKIDNVQVQSYVGSASSFASILDYLQTLINDKTKAYPAFAVKSSGNLLPLTEIYQFIDVTRSKGFKGNSIWYSNDLRGIMRNIRDNRYATKTYPPFSTPTWREFKDIVLISNQSKAIRYGNWTLSYVAGYENTTLVAQSGDSASISYYFDVPVNGYYDVYAFIVPTPDQSTNVKYVVIDSAGHNIFVEVDQTNSLNRRWYKLATVYLSKGRRLVGILSNTGISAGKKVRADAMYIKLNRKLSPNVSTDVLEEKDLNYNDYELHNFPNPFNSFTTIKFTFPQNKEYNLQFYNLLGQKVKEISGLSSSTGINYVNIDSTIFSSGVYFYTLRGDKFSKTSKLIVMK